MPLPSPNLDDLRFQRDLVDEARRRIIRYCPEWTDYNLSDPGITLIELFAWMTEMIVYRLNRVPEKTYIKFLEMMGIQLLPASSARAELTFYLSAPLPISPEDDTIVVVPEGLEVTTRGTEQESEVTYTTDEELRIAPPHLLHLRREEDFPTNYLPDLGVDIFYAFNRQQPREGDTFYLGFDAAQPIRGYILRLTFECQETEAVGVRREDPPWVWECLMEDGIWEEVSLSTRQGERDTTGGLNNAQGSLVLYLPLSLAPEPLYGRTAHWLRCRVEQRRQVQGMYRESPRVRNITAHVLGGTTRASHAVRVPEELLGESNGEPGQQFHLQNAPILALGPRETVEVEELRDGELSFVPWQLMPDFAQSTRYDRHFALDGATGEVSFGPAVRQPDGSVHQYGRIPEAGRRIRFSRYRHGGGVAGNVPAGRIQVLRSTVPYIDRVTNLTRAEGGRDQESLEEAQIRARRELRAQQRAVTAEDYEVLGRGATRRVARVKCLAPSATGGPLTAGTVVLLVVPAASDALAAGDLSKLALETDLRDQVQAHLDRYRLLTTTLSIREPNYLGVKVYCEAVATEYMQAEPVAARIRESLTRFLSPLSVGSQDGPQDGILGPDWEGWPFGRDLYLPEIASLVHRVPGVKHVLEVQVSYCPVVPSKEVSPPLKPLGQERVLEVPPDTLLCSLEHEIKVHEG